MISDPALFPLRRSPTGRGRPFPPEGVAAVRRLVEETTLPLREIAGAAGLLPVTVSRWTRRSGWRRPPGAPPPGYADADGPLPAPLRKVWCHGPDTREQARVLIEETRLGTQPIALRLGISIPTLWRWRRDGGWTRPSPEGRVPRFYRYRRRLGSPFAADAVGLVRTLATTTRLSTTAIAAQTGLSQDTVTRWIRRNGWERPPNRRGRLPLGRLQRTAPLRASGNRHGLPYAPEVVAEARALYQTTGLSTRIIAARLRVSRSTIIVWARKRGWLPFRDAPGPYGVERRRRR